MKASLIGVMVALALAGAGWAFWKIGGNGKIGTSGMAGATDATAGKQVIEITAKNGYSPSVITAKAGVPVLLKMKTDDTQDCSTAFTVPAFGIQALLPATGEMDFNFPAQKAGETIDASCQMGMARFTIEFK